MMPPTMVTIDGDTLNINFLGMGGSDLDTVTVNGSGGSDAFVLLRDRADGIVIADAVRIERVNVTGEGTGSLLAPSTGSGTITVTLTDVGANGNVIADAVRVEALFGPEIEVSQGGSADPILVNQRLDPSEPMSVPGVGTSLVDSGGTFADLSAAYAHSGGDLVVSLTDASINGWIIADAIRVAATAPPPIMTGFAAGGGLLGEGEGESVILSPAGATSVLDGASDRSTADALFAALADSQNNTAARDQDVDDVFARWEEDLLELGLE